MKLFGNKNQKIDLFATKIPKLIDFENPEKNWFDLYHQHIASLEFKPKNWESRKLCLDALFKLASEYEKQIVKLNRAYQFWILINDIDCHSDAVYVHTKNPNNSEFPWKVQNNLSLRSKNNKLEDYLLGKDYKIIRVIFVDEKNKQSINYFLQKPNLGIPLD